MAEYIDRDILLKNIEQEPMSFLFTKSTALAFIREAVADVVEVRHGKWVAEEYESVSKRNRIIKYKVYSCSVCGKSIGKARKKYCPNCGARMDKEED